MPETNAPFIIGIPVYQGVDLLDFSAPCEIFSWMGEVWRKKPGGRVVNVFLVAKTIDPIRTRDGIQITPHKSFADLKRLDLLFVPGGSLEGLVNAGNDPSFVEFLKSRGCNAQYVTSVCEGALLLARAGLLKGYDATTHSAFKNCLNQFDGVNVVEGFPRYVVDRNRVTGGGISAGLDECIKLVEILAGTEVARAVRRTIEYFPEFVEQDLSDPPDCPLGDLQPKWPTHAPIPEDHISGSGGCAGPTYSSNL